MEAALAVPVEAADELCEAGGDTDLAPSDDLSSTSMSFSEASLRPIELVLLLLMMIDSIVFKYWCFEMVAVFMKIVLT